MRLVKGLALIIFLGANLLAQSPTQAERDEMYRRYLEFPKYVKGGKVEPHWMADGNTFWYAEGAPENTVIWKVDPVVNTKERLFDTLKLRTVLKTVLGHEPPYAGIPFDEFNFHEDDRTARFEVQGRHFALQLHGYGLREVEPTSKDEIDLKTARTWQGRYAWLTPSEILSPDEKWFAGIENHNLYLRSTLDGQKVLVTSDGEPDHEWQLGRYWLGYSGLWSPDGRYLATKKMDYRDVPAIPLVHYLEAVEEVEWVNYFASGQNWPRSELYIIDTLSHEKVNAAIDHEAAFHSVLDWKSDSSEVYLLARSRYMTGSDNYAQIVAVNPLDKTSQVVLRSKVNGRFTLLPKSERFLWSSSGKLFLYNLEGQLLLQLTGGDSRFIGLVSVDEDSGWVYYLARGDPKRPFDEHLYRVRTDGGDPEQLTKASGLHSIQFSPSKRFFLDTHSSIDRPPRVELRRADGEWISNLCEADTTRLRELNWAPGEEFVVKDAQGVGEIRGVLYKPADFDPARKYPLVQWIYPTRRILFQRAFVPRWHGSLKAQALAQLGFVTFVMRKSSTRSSDVWERAGFAGTVTADSVATMRQLAAERSFIDLNRVGIYGSSKGGFYSILAILEAPELYDVAVSVAGITDMAAHIGNHPFLGPPGRNSEAFKASSVLHLAEKLKGKLLLAHGTGDTAVPISHTMKMADALIRANKHFDMLIMPEETHMTLNIFDHYGLDAAIRYFVEHLNPYGVSEE